MQAHQFHTFLTFAICFMKWLLNVMHQPVQISAKLIQSGAPQVPFRALLAHGLPQKAPFILGIPGSLMSLQHLGPEDCGACFLHDLTLSASQGLFWKPEQLRACPTLWRHP